MTRRLCTLLVALGAVLGLLSAGCAWARDVGIPAFVDIPASTVPLLSQAHERTGAPGPAQLTVTVVLRRRDQAGFSAFLAAVQDLGSPDYRHFATASQLTARYGPSAAAYREVLAYVRAAGLRVLAGSPDRLTVTARGSAAAVQRAFHSGVAQYSLAGRGFFANSLAPQLPAPLARVVAGVDGLSSLDRPTVPRPADDGKQRLALAAFPNPNSGTLADSCWLIEVHPGLLLPSLEEDGGGELSMAGFDCAADELNLISAYVAGLHGHVAGAQRSHTSAPAIGSGEKIGLLEFANFHPSDVSDYLALANEDPGLISNLSEQDVAGGAGSPGTGESEVLLDVDAALTLAPGAQVVVYDTAFNGGASFSAMFNAMIADGDNVISNSWSECEDQVSRADAQDVDSILAQAAAEGVSVLNSAGDSGSTCLDGSPNTIGVPADSPNATAVGGSSEIPGPGGTYGSERYWNGTNETEPSGQGGFGTSRFFSTPSYQQPFSGGTNMRSIPDVGANSDPDEGYLICQADEGGCPSGLVWGGTSVAAPMWAAFAADLDSLLGRRLGDLNTLLYPLGGSGAFHSAAAMGSDFAHVGLGSPNLDAIERALAGAAPGPVSAATSTLKVGPGAVYADGHTPVTLVATLTDAAGHTVAGKHVTLTASAGSHALVAGGTGSPSSANAVSSTSNGAVSFEVTDTVPETVTFTAVDTDDGVTLPTATVTFGSPPAAAAGIAAQPTTVAADNASTSQITVTLQDAAGDPVSGKEIQLSASAGTHSVIAGPTPTLTNAQGQTTFTVTDNVDETVTYGALDVSDGNLPFQGSALVNFTNAAPGNTNCQTGTPTAAAGYAVSDYATGFALDPSDFGCVGPIGIAFAPDGSLYVVDAANQVLYRFPPGGGVADTLTEVGPLPPSNAADGNAGTIFGIAFGSDGSLYATAGGGFEGGGGAVLQLNPATAALKRVLVQMTSSSNGNDDYTGCALGIAPDPLSGDLMVTQPGCTLLGGEPFVERVIGPTSNSPTIVHYTGEAGSANRLDGDVDGITIAPDGTIFAADEDGGIEQIGATAGPQPAPVTDVIDLTTASGAKAPVDGVGVGEDPGSTHPAFLFVNRNDGIIDKLDLSTTPPTVTQIFSGGSRGDFVTVGPDGCLYATQTDRIVKLTNADGTCSLSSTAVVPQLGLTPASVSPAPVQSQKVTLTADVTNVAQPAGIPVTFTVRGANAQTGVASTDATGKATFTYTGANAGMDLVTASATAGATALTSTQSTIRCKVGPQQPALDLALAPTGGTSGAAAQLTAVLDDVTTNPARPLAGAAVTLTLGGAACAATTDASGRAVCTITPSVPAGLATLAATFAGNASYAASSSSQGFLVSTKAQTVAGYTGATAATYGATVTLGGHLTLAAGGAALPGRALELALGAGARPRRRASRRPTPPATARARSAPSTSRWAATP